MSLDDLVALVNRFADRRGEYTHPRYSEAQVRIDFLNPFFTCLGWDVTNRAALAGGEREVVTEPRQRKADGGIEFPDYLFRTAGRPIFAVEAKKPSVNLHDDSQPALQLRRYAWNSKAFGIGVLTDFEEFSVYDCRLLPSASDSASTARVDYYTFEQYLDLWQEIDGRFGREAVLEGSLEEYAVSMTGARGKQRVDRVFLGELNAWRTSLARVLSGRNDLTVVQLNQAVQLLVDRVVFLRICEDRGLEPYGELRDLTNGAGIYERLLHKFRRADERYNSGLFHFDNEKGRVAPDVLSKTLKVSDENLRYFINRLYWPTGPYNFAVFPSDVLGHVYEQFLGQVITLDEAGTSVDVQDKPEVRRAGGVYYTPTSVVRHIVRATLGPLLEGSTPDRLMSTGLFVCDPACGSGSFLIEVYEHLLAWYLQSYIREDPNKYVRTRPARLRRDAGGSWRLTTAERKRILLRHIFGVDIDAQAVEVTKLSLLLKVLEEESYVAQSTTLELFHERVLPDLDRNIRCGNSLVGNAFHFTEQPTLDATTEARINAFDWPVEFEVVAAGRGFDALVGNPPWLMAGYHVSEVVPYLKERFVTATGKFDLYYVFLEQAIRLLAPQGRLGMIVPNKFFHTGAAAALRSLLANTFDLERIDDFGLAKVFEGATNYSCILSGVKRPPSSTLAFRRLTQELASEQEFPVPRQVLQGKTWTFQDEDARQVFAAVHEAGVPLEELVDRFGTGVQSGADRLLTLPRMQYELLELESNVGRVFLRGRDVRAFELVTPGRVLLFPYRDDGAAYSVLTEQELRAYPNARRYLQTHRARLSQRVWFDKSAEELSGAWYGLMYVEARRWLLRPHLLTPSLSPVGNFAVGDGSLWATGTAGVTSVVPKTSVKESLHYWLAVLNSDVVAVFMSQHSPPYQGGFYKYSAPYLRKIPVPRLPPSASRARQIEADIGSLVRQAVGALAELQTGQDENSAERSRRRLGAARHEINREVHALYGLTDHQSRWVRSAFLRLRGVKSNF